MTQKNASGDLRGIPISKMPLSVTFLLAEINEVHFHEILRNVPLVPHLLEFRCTFLLQPGATVFEDFGRDHLRSRFFPAVRSFSAPPADLASEREHRSAAASTAIGVRQCCLLPQCKAEERVGQQVIFRAGSQKKGAIIVTVNRTVGTRNSFPGSVFGPDAGIEVAKDNQFVRLRHSRQDGMQVVG
ncbi:unnamed protein product [Schistocephalus solidus]|uniref:Uncharacterized protein n=1 Tax=Schistocephalus solidus TaxID=70667 RepID=A0A183SMC5_SCHSO|nr:unnamed protein product [Schistocephalus solidus]